MLTSATTPRQICVTNKDNNTKVEVIMTFDSQVGYAGIKQADEEKLKRHQSTNADDFTKQLSKMLVMRVIWSKSIGLGLVGILFSLMCVCPYTTCNRIDEVNTMPYVVLVAVQPQCQARKDRSRMVCSGCLAFAVGRKRKFALDLASPAV